MCIHNTKPIQNESRLNNKLDFTTRTINGWESFRRGLKHKTNGNYMYSNVDKNNDFITESKTKQYWFLTEVEGDIFEGERNEVGVMFMPFSMTFTIKMKGK